MSALWMVEVPPYRSGITFTIWEDARALMAYAYRGGAHGDAVRDGGGSDFAEFLAARFVPLASRGDLDGVDPLAGRLAQPA